MNKKLIKILFLIPIIILISYSYFIEPRKLEVNKYIVKNAQVKGIKIVFASDFHIKPYQKKRLENIVRIINNENPDLVLATGDYVCGHTKHSTMPIEGIAKILGNVKTKYGFYTTLGNHDGWYGKEEITNALEKNGIKVLSNTNVLINTDNQKFYIAGVEDLMTGNPNIYKSVKGININENLVIMLTHTPDMFPKVPKAIKLTFAGHTHGGQIRIPLIGPIFTASKYYNKNSQGWIQEVNSQVIKPDLTEPIDLKQKTLFVTRGIGLSILPFRFNCIPEINIIEFE